MNDLKGRLNSRFGSRSDRPWLVPLSPAARLHPPAGGLRQRHAARSMAFIEDCSSVKLVCPAQTDGALLLDIARSRQDGLSIVLDEHYICESSGVL